MKRPNFFIVGAPKSGTTALCEYLKQHPDVFMPSRKELGYFGSDLEYTQRFVRPRNQQEYLRFFSGWSTEARAGEASVWYLYSRNAALELKDFSPTARIIIMLRDPVDVLYSNYYQLLYNGNEDLRTFEEALAAEPRRRSGLDIPATTMLVDALYYRETVRFSDQVERYLKTFGSKAVHTILFDDFTKDTATEYRRVLEFLGVDPDFMTDFPRINANKRVRSTLLWRMMRIGPLVWFARRFPSFARHIYAPVRQVNTVAVSRPPMALDTKRILQREFRGEIDSLAVLLRKDLSHWCVES